MFYVVILSHCGPGLYKL